MSTETRLTALEAAVSELQHYMQGKASLANVKILLAAVETTLDTNGTDHTGYETRIGLIERHISSLRSTLQALNDEGVAIKMNLVATEAPAITNDEDSGYSVSSRWFDITNDQEYVCLDETSGAAVWKQTT